MSALYIMKFVGMAGFGGGVVYVGRGTVLGADVAEIRFVGSYTEENGRLRGTVSMHIPAGVQLVTGMSSPMGGTIPLQLDVPADLGGGSPVAVSVAGRGVNVTFTKLGDVP